MELYSTNYGKFMEFRGVIPITGYLQKYLHEASALRTKQLIRF